MQAEDQPIDGQGAYVLTGFGGVRDVGETSSKALTRPLLASQVSVSANGIPRSGSIPDAEATRQDSTASYLINEAIAIAKWGLRVFPVRAPVGGRCSCFSPGCDKPGKHPHIVRYNERATTSVDQVVNWWTDWPDANVGVACGDGLIVIDIDGDQGEEWIAEREMPDTLTATSGRGRHFYYVGDTPGKLSVGPKVDLLGKGRYVVAPPSLHASGTRYQWSNGQRQIVDAPEWVYERASAPAASRPIRKRQAQGIATGEDAIYAEGQRNDAMFRCASAMRRGSGMDADEIRAALAITNTKHCQPPLPQAELGGIAESAAARANQFPDYATLRDLALLPSQLAIFVALLAEANAMGECTASYDVLAAKALVRLSTAQRAVSELRRRGVVSWKYRPFRSDRYEICDRSAWKGANSLQGEGA
jgi:Bifunctional DNA primase/polymerase, N-terminal/Primase C terminal 1 (PriCT-1)